MAYKTMPTSSRKRRIPFARIYCEIWMARWTHPIGAIELIMVRTQWYMYDGNKCVSVIVVTPSPMAMH